MKAARRVLEDYFAIVGKRVDWKLFVTQQFDPTCYTKGDAACLYRRGVFRAWNAAKVSETST